MSSGGDWKEEILSQLLVGEPYPTASGTGIIAGPASVLPPPLDTWLLDGIVFVTEGAMSYMGIRDDGFGTLITEFGFVSQSSGFIIPLYQTIEDVPDEGTLKFVGDTINRYWFDAARVKFSGTDFTVEGGNWFIIDTPVHLYDAAYMTWDGKDAGKGLRDYFEAISSTTVYNGSAEALCTNYFVQADLKLGRRYEIGFDYHWDMNDSAGRGIARIRKTNLAGSQLRTDTIVNGNANQRMRAEIRVEYEPTADETAAKFVLTMTRQTGAANIVVRDHGVGDPCYGWIRDITDNLTVRQI